MTGREILYQALLLMDRIDCDGRVDTENTADYENKALILLNPLIFELAKAERREYQPISGLEEEISLSEDTIRNCLVHGLASGLSFMDNDMNFFQFYRMQYEAFKEQIPTEEEGVTDTFHMLGGLLS